MYPRSFKYFLVLATLITLAFINSKRTRLTLYIIGDSTAANKAPKAFPETGWGMEIASYLNDEVKVDNRAVNGRSTKSFINENKWQAVESQLKPGDFVLIEFGHNDEKLDKPAVGTTLAEYKANLTRFVKATQAKKAYPILMTPIMRRSFKEGQFRDTHLGYPAIVRQLADSLQVPLIDMHRKTEQLIVSLGEEESKKLFNYVELGHANYPDGKKDDTHLSPYGAKVVAGLVAEGIRETQTDLAKYLKK